MADLSTIDEEGADSAAITGGGDSIQISGNIVNSTIIIKSIVRDEQAVDLELLAPEPGEPPYKGLQYFEEEDAGSFFGREQPVLRVISRLHRTRFLAIIGASGSGKSSLIRAGVVPSLKSGAALADGSMPPSGSARWLYRVLTPGGHPLDALGAALSAEGALPSQISSLRDELAKDPGALALAARSLLSQEKRPHLLLVVDQFEEIFTQARSAEEREAFLHALVAASKSDDVQPVSLLICLRADFYAQVAQDDHLREMVSQHQEFIGAMSRAELVDAIVAPLAKDNWKIQEGLVKVILDDVGFEPGSLPLLSHALLETWKRRHGRTLTLSAYVDCGGVEGAVRQTADSVFENRLAPEQQPVARMIFLSLAELNDNAKDTRRRAPFSELITRSTDEPTIQAVINILADARLVTTSTLAPGDLKVVEVAHESLIREWPTLRNWLSEDRQGLILHRQLTDAAEDWAKNQRDAGLLIRGARLKQVHDWAIQGNNANTLSLQDAGFLEASQANALHEARKEARLRRTQTIFAGVTILLLGLVALLLRPKPPVMAGEYNVAIANIGEILPSGQVRAMPDGAGAASSQNMTRAIQQALSGNPEIWTWNDRSELRRQGVQIGTLESDTPQAQTQAAAVLAQRLHADMVIYGALDRRQQPQAVVVQIYLTPKLSDALGEIQGSFQLDTPIPVTSDLQANAVQTQINHEANLLALLALAQSESRTGHTLEALEYYLKAAQLAPDSDLLQFFIGREYLFTIDRKPIPAAANPAFEQSALGALQKALQLNPNNARAYVGLGSAYLKQAQPMAEAAGSAGLNDQSFQTVARVLDQAESAYGRVLQPGLDTSAYGVPMQDIARLGVGDTRLLRGVALQENHQTAQARMEFNRAIQELQQTLPAFQAPELSRYLAQNHQFLGSAYEWSGYLSELAGDAANARQAYQQANQELSACVTMGNSSSDRIIKTDIVEGNCQPMLQQSEQRLKVLEGGS